MSDADCTPGREPRSVAASILFAIFLSDMPRLSILLGNHILMLVCICMLSLILIFAVTLRQHIFNIHVKMARLLCLKLNNFATY